MTRDGGAFELVLAGLSVRGGVFLRDIVPQFPPDCFAEEPPEDVDLQPGALLVLTTRPPLNDDSEGSKRWVARSHTRLEEAVLSSLSAHFFESCSRDRVSLRADIEGRLTANQERASIEFYVSGPQEPWESRHLPVYKRWGRSRDEPPPNKVVGYLAYEPVIGYEASPSLLVTFGMSGTTNLLWAALLASGGLRDPAGVGCIRLPDIVAGTRPRLLMAEFEPWTSFGPRGNERIPASALQAADSLVQRSKVVVDVQL